MRKKTGNCETKILFSEKEKFDMTSDECEKDEYEKDENKKDEYEEDEDKG